jgi:dipeptidyl aminopeptidase/acylaminoacyl peptidase
MVPRTFTRRAAAALALLLCAGAPLHAAPAASAPPPIERFFANPVLVDAKLSPSARYLAAISGAPDRRDVLMVIDLQAKTAKVVAGYGKVDIRRFQWVNDERLAYDVTDKRIAVGKEFRAAGLYAVNRDGSNPRQLASRQGDVASETNSRIKTRIQPWHTFMLDQEGAQNADSIYVASYQFEDRREDRNVVRTVNLLKLDTVTGFTEPVQRPTKVDRWLLDHKGEPRVATASEKGITTVHYLDPATSTWRVLTTFNTYKASEDPYTPIGFGSDGTLYAKGYGDKADTKSLFAINLATGKRNKNPVIDTPGYDFDGELISNGEKLLGVQIETDAAAVVWFDPAMKAAQEKLDAALPGTVNLMSFSHGVNQEWALVKAYSDVRPASYYLFNLKTSKLDPVGDTYPGIDPTRMGRQDPVRYKARDGMDIPALLTLPANGAKNAPLVVLVHGGPTVRGTRWGWNPASQFLASRGYAVLEPEFRGSTGYGDKHYRAGLKQWGLTMQDDIADGARWAIAQGIADPKRICIAGASYGGYATLMGLAKDPDLYKCGVNWVGVTDINLLYNGHWSQSSDTTDEDKEYGLPEEIGDPVKDAARFKATSPIEQAARIKAPLLMAYGGADERVPMYHGRKFMEAVKPFNQQVEWIEYQDEGHGWGLPANRVDFWGRVEKFLDKHIGKGVAN